MRSFIIFISQFIKTEAAIEFRLSTLVSIHYGFHTFLEMTNFTSRFVPWISHWEAAPVSGVTFGVIKIPQEKNSQQTNKDIWG